jgi:hypothetical protein
MFSQNPLSSFDKLHINTQLLAMRYKDTLVLLDKGRLDDTFFTAHIRRMLFSYGSKHSGNKTGLFVDLYLRDATLGSCNGREANLTTIVRYLLKESQDEEFIPIHDMNIVNKIFNKPAYKIIYIGDVEFIILRIPKNDFEEVKKKLGHTGQLLSKNMQFWLLANLSLAQDLFAHILKELDPRLRDKFDQYLNELAYQPSNKEASEIHASILTKLQALPKKFNIRSQIFFLHFLQKLIFPLKTLLTKNNAKNSQIQLSFSRLEYILTAGLQKITHYETFICYVEYAFDEIIFLVSLTEKIQQDEVLGSLVSFIENQYSLNAESKVVPTQVALSNSGMESLTNLIYAAIDEVKSFPGFKTTNMYLQTRFYYEILPVIRHRLQVNASDLEYHKEICYLMGKEKTTIGKYYEFGIYGILICAFNANLNVETEQNDSSDIDALIKKQLDNRREEDCEDLKLIVIIDTSLNSFDDSRIRSLLKHYKEQIQNGKLAVLIGHSLNKYFHVGFDKLPAGLSIGFFQKDQYPTLAKYFKDKPCDRYFKHDPTPKMLNHILKNADQDIANYYRLIKANAVFVHEKIVPEELLEHKSKKIFSICQPYTVDRQDIWGFLAFKIHISAGQEKIRDCLMQELNNIFAVLHVEVRDGYGFHKTSWCNIAGIYLTLYRINIGAESHLELKGKLAPLMQFFSDVNTLMEVSSQRLHSDRICYLIKGIAAKITKKPPENLPSLATFQNNDMVDCPYQLGQHYEEIKEDKEAFAWYYIAAIQENMRAIYKVAKCYEEGRGVLKNFAKALSFYQQAASLGHAGAQYRLGLYYENGQERDMVLSAIFFTKAALNRHKSAFFKMPPPDKGVSKVDSIKYFSLKGAG